MSEPIIKHQPILPITRLEIARTLTNEWTFITDAGTSRVVQLPGMDGKRTKYRTDIMLPNRQANKLTALFKSIASELFKMDQADIVSEEEVKRLTTITLEKIKSEIFGGPKFSAEWYKEWKTSFHYAIPDRHMRELPMHGGHNMSHHQTFFSMLGEPHSMLLSCINNDSGVTYCFSFKGIYAEHIPVDAEMQQEYWDWFAPSTFPVVQEQSPQHLPLTFFYAPKGPKTYTA